MGEPGLDLHSTQDNVRLSARLLRLLLDRTAAPSRRSPRTTRASVRSCRVGISTGGARYAAIITARQAWFS